jgi:hypothetical protein
MSTASTSGAPSLTTASVISSDGWKRQLHTGSFSLQRSLNSNGIRSFTSDSSSPTSDDNSSISDTSTPTQPTSISGSSQHDTWVQFQRSIAVTGFETGQTVKERTLGKKNRGGKADRKRKEREAELEAAISGVDNTQVRLLLFDRGGDSIDV